MSDAGHLRKVAVTFEASEIVELWDAARLNEERRAAVVLVRVEPHIACVEASDSPRILACFNSSDIATHRARDGLAALSKTRALLAPGGTLVVIGCYRERTWLDHLVGLVAIPANMVLGLLKSPGAAA